MAGGLADSQKVVVNSPRASGEVGGICVAIHRSSPRRIGRSGPVVVDSGKRALGTEAEGKTGCCGVTNSVASATRWSVELGWLSAGGVGRVAPEKEDVVASGAANSEEVVELC
jgi:hypothetical protein